LVKREKCPNIDRWAAGWKVGRGRTSRIKFTLHEERRGPWLYIGPDSTILMSTRKRAVSPDADDLTLSDGDAPGFRIHWYRCNVCGTDFEDSSSSHRRRLQMLLDHKRLHRHQPVPN
jgi:hypothetical protein